jgi:hypothetical protein
MSTSRVPCLCGTFHASLQPSPNAYPGELEEELEQNAGGGPREMAGDGLQEAVGRGGTAVRRQFSRFLIKGRTEGAGEMSSARR